MEYFSGTIWKAVGIFAATNIDDFVVLTALFVSLRVGGAPSKWKIWVGQYAGASALVGISAVAALGLAPVPIKWIGLLGLVPLTLGVRGLILVLRGHADEPNSATSIMSIFAVLVSNGGDNISIYTPLFRTLNVGQGLLTVTIFAVLSAVWCIIAGWVSFYPKLTALVRRHSHWLIPVVYIIIGSRIILRFA